MVKFYDTNALLILGSQIFEDEMFYISSVSLKELEHIKTSHTKTEDVRYQARVITRLLEENPHKYKVVLYRSGMDDFIKDRDLESTPDTQICACAKRIVSSEDEEIIFVTGDLCCELIAKNIFGLKVSGLDTTDPSDYTGYFEIHPDEESLAYFYEHPTENIYNLLTNQYLIIKDSDGIIIDRLRWNGTSHQPVKIANMKTEYFGPLKAYNGDVYQQCVLDSLSNNQVTMIKGPAGTGKSYLALGYLFYLLEKHKIDKIVVFCNTVATSNSAKLGFYPGTKDEKLIDSAIGNMLGAKLGGQFAVERLIQDNKLQLLPMSDIRGFDTSGMNAGIYITEAQNMDITLMKLALQRIGEDCICIIDGDYQTQVDLPQYSGRNNGMRRLSEVFRGQDFYGEVELKNIYRSRIAALAEKM